MRVANAAYWPVLVTNEVGDVLLDSAGSLAMPLILPLILIEEGVRPACAIREALRRKYQLDVFCITDHELAAGQRMMLAECISAEGLADSPIRWANPEHAAVTAGLSAAAVLRALAASPRDTERPGFWRQLTEWVSAVMGETCGTPPPRLSDQFSGGHGFCLARLETSRGPVWFKAVNAPNESEPLITSTLASRHPAHVPRVLARHERWSAWLAEDVNARTVAGQPAEAWACAARDMARIQIAELNAAHDWLTVGCHDLRVGTLTDRVSVFFAGMNDVMRRQVTSSPAPLTQGQLQVLEAAVRRALDDARLLGDTLVHADLNPGNILVDGDRAVFLDWAAASVGYPCSAIENLRGHFVKRRADINHGVVARMVGSYYDCWRDAFGTVFVDAMRRDAGLLRYATLAMRSAGWLWGIETPPQAEPLLRSLARSMYQVVQAR
jgi:hypothetical protein